MMMQAANIMRTSSSQQYHHHNPLLLLSICFTSSSINRTIRLKRRRFSGMTTVSSSSSLCCSFPPSQSSLRFAVLGAGFAGLSVAYHLLQQSPRGLRLCIDIYDEAGIGGGASGVSGGLLHPYSPKAKLLWRGEECWKESLNLLRIAESEAEAAFRESKVESGQNDHFLGFVRRRGILRPAMNLKNLNILNDNAQSCIASCRIESVDNDAVQHLVPHLEVPFNSVFYMPEAVNVHSQQYLEALFYTCERLVKVGFGGKDLLLHKKSINSLSELSGEYNAVIICLGAKAGILSELSGKLPLRTCRGVIAQMQLPDNTGEVYPDHSPSILSDAWLAIQGPRHLSMGSTWDWKSRNYSQNVSSEEASKALEELLPKASTVYPGIMKWNLCGARAGLRAMPPRSPNGSLPLLGCIDDYIGRNNGPCKHWLFGGLGSRGLLYHAWLGKLTAQAVLSCNEGLIPAELLSWKTKALI